MQDNFKKRFGDPPRIEVIYPKKKLSLEDQEIQSKKLVKGYMAILRGLLGREPVDKDILGKVDNTKALARRVRGRRQTGKGANGQANYHKTAEGHFTVASGKEAGVSGQIEEPTG